MTISMNDYGKAKKIQNDELIHFFLPKEYTTTTTTTPNDAEPDKIGWAGRVTGVIYQKRRKTRCVMRS